AGFTLPGSFYLCAAEPVGEINFKLLRFPVSAYTIERARVIGFSPETHGFKHITYAGFYRSFTFQYRFLQSQVNKTHCLTSEYALPYRGRYVQARCFSSPGFGKLIGSLGVHRIAKYVFPDITVASPKTGFINRIIRIQVRKKCKCLITEGITYIQTYHIL